MCGIRDIGGADRLVIHKVISLLLIIMPFSACAEDIRSVYTKLDEAISNTEKYKAEKQKSIEKQKLLLRLARNADGLYEHSMALYLEYRVFQNDSALTFLFNCIDLAKKMKRSDLESYCNLLVAHQYVVSGYFTNAEQYFENVNPRLFKGEQLNTYYYYKNHLYRELEQYCSDEVLRQRYRGLALTYLDSVNSTLKPEYELYYQRRCISLFFKQEYEKAMRINDEWMKNVRPRTRGYANMAYYRSEIYRIRHKPEKQKYWLALGAICELECAINNQTSLWNLAQIMQNDGDLKRAFNYIDVSWRCISYFSPHKRSWVVVPILTSINENYRGRLNNMNTNLLSLSVIVGFLSVFLLVALFVVLKDRKVITKSKVDVQQAYEALSGLNEELKLLNARLVDSNRVKDEYITYFFHICLKYIEKLDNFRIKVNRNLKANQIKYTIQFTDSEQLKEDEMKGLLNHFDTVFLHLFPSFIVDFNKLLRDDCKTFPKESGTLNTPLRIFALIRLGITESSNIAEFLDYSPNSIYAYRARIKNGAIGNRADFERQVMEIGLKGI